MGHENYISRKSRLLKSFDKSIARVKGILIYRYGEEKADILGGMFFLMLKVMVEISTMVLTILNVLLVSFSAHKMQWSWHHTCVLLTRLQERRWDGDYVGK